MSVKELENRIAFLEKAVSDLQMRLPATGINGQEDPTKMDPKSQPHWWREGAGRFKDDPIFDEIVRLGREYRDSLDTDQTRKKSRNGRPKTKK
jgi:hypothetical protein